MNYTEAAPQLKKVVNRNEKVQADTIVDLLTIYRTEGIHGAFVFEFIEPSHPHSHDPRLDLDTASYGVVKAYPSDPETPDSVRWEPKEAFHALAKFYGS